MKTCEETIPSKPIIGWFAIEITSNNDTQTKDKNRESTGEKGTVAYATYILWEVLLTPVCAIVLPTQLLEIILLIQN